MIYSLSMMIIRFKMQNIPWFAKLNPEKFTLKINCFHIYTLQKLIIVILLYQYELRNNRERKRIFLFFSRYIETSMEVNIVVLSLAKGNMGMNSTVKLDNPSTMKAKIMDFNIVFRRSPDPRAFGNFCIQTFTSSIMDNRKEVQKFAI